MQWFESAVRIGAAAFFLLLFCQRLYSQSRAQIEETLRQAVKLNPDSWDSNYRLGEFYLQSGRLSDGLPFMEQAVALQPLNYAAEYDLALAYFESHQYLKARRRIESTLKQRDSAELHSLLADMEEAAGDYLKAAAEYQGAAQMDPSENHIFDWGTEFVIHQTYGPAIDIFKRGVELHPASLKLHVGLGVALYLGQQYGEAFTQLCAATDLNPAEAWPYAFLGSSFVAVSSRVETEQVQKRLKRFATDHPHNAQALYYYAMSLWDRNQSSQQNASEAESLLQKATNLDKDFVDAHLELGTLYSDQHNDSGAISEFSSVLRTQPNLATAHYRLAQVYTRAGHRDLASEELKIFERLRSTETEESQAERNRIMRFVISMRDQPGSAPAK